MHRWNLSPSEPSLYGNVKPEPKEAKEHIAEPREHEQKERQPQQLPLLPSPAAGGSSSSSSANGNGDGEGLQNSERPERQDDASADGQKTLPAAMQPQQQSPLRAKSPAASPSVSPSQSGLSASPGRGKAHKAKRLSPTHSRSVSSDLNELADVDAQQSDDLSTDAAQSQAQSPLQTVDGAAGVPSKTISGQPQLQLPRSGSDMGFAAMRGLNGLNVTRVTCGGGFCMALTGQLTLVPLLCFQIAVSM